MRIDTFVDNVLDQLKDFLPAGTPVHFELNVLAGHRYTDDRPVIALLATKNYQYQHIGFDVSMPKDHTLSRPGVEWALK